MSEYAGVCLVIGGGVEAVSPRRLFGNLAEDERFVALACAQRELLQRRRSHQNVTYSILRRHSQNLMIPYTIYRRKPVKNLLHKSHELSPFLTRN